MKVELHDATTTSEEKRRPVRFCPLFDCSHLDDGTLFAVSFGRPAIIRPGKIWPAKFSLSLAAAAADQPLKRSSAWGGFLVGANINLAAGGRQKCDIELWSGEQVAYLITSSPSSHLLALASSFSEWSHANRFIIGDKIGSRRTFAEREAKLRWQSRTRWEREPKPAKSLWSCNYSKLEHVNQAASGWSTFYELQFGEVVIVNSTLISSRSKSHSSFKRKRKCSLSLSCSPQLIGCYSPGELFSG